MKSLSSSPQQQERGQVVVQALGMEVVLSCFQAPGSWCAFPALGGKEEEEEEEEDGE